MSMKTEIVNLKRENTRLKNANVGLNKSLNQAQQDALDSNASYEGSVSDLAASEARVEELIEERDRFRENFIEQKNERRDLTDECNQLKKTISEQTQQISNHEDLLRDIQRDMKTVCEAAYGNIFDPTWRGDDPDSLWHDGGEYRRVMQSTGEVLNKPTEYLEPGQRLLRMIWRRCHWGLNPIPYGRSWDEYGESPR